MKAEPSETKTGLDRMATAEEVQSAFSLIPDFTFEMGKEAFFEIPSDRGGYVHMEIEEGVLELLATSDEVVN